MATNFLYFHGKRSRSFDVISKQPLYVEIWKRLLTSYNESSVEKKMDRLVIWMMPKCIRLAAYALYYFLKATMVACYVTGIVLVICTKPGGYIETICGTTATRSALMALTMAQTFHNFRERTAQVNSMIISGMLKSINIIRRISDSVKVFPCSWR